MTTADLADYRLRAHLAHTDPANARLVVGVPPLFIDLRAELMGAPAGRCVDDCLTLLHAYAQLGFTAQVRVAQLAIVEEPDGRTSTHGTATPRWQDGLLHGHTVLWLPNPGYLIDVTCDQFPPLDERGAGPVIATTTRPAPAGTEDGLTARVEHGGLVLNYTLAAWQATRDVLNHPQVRHDDPGHRLRGINVAGATIGLLTKALTPRRTRVLTHQRAAALITAARQTTPVDHPDLGPRFLTTPPAGEDPRLLTLDELPLPAATPGPASVKLWPTTPPAEEPLPPTDSTSS